MKNWDLKGCSIQFDRYYSDACPFLQAKDLYTNVKELPAILTGKKNMSCWHFYEGELAEIPQEAYNLSRAHQGIITRYPHTNATIKVDEKGCYIFEQVPVYVKTVDYLLALLNPEHHQTFLTEIKEITNLTAVSITDLPNLNTYKLKKLSLNGQYGKRELLHDSHQQNVKPIQDKLFLSRELYYFSHYLYAGMIQFLPEFQIETYEQFHEYYGKYVYSFTLTKGEKTIPLLWPDYLYHQPENHLEFGIIADPDHPRYNAFTSWHDGEEVTLTILAQGFEDLILTTKLKKKQIILPHLSKKSYFSDESLELTVDAELLEEIKTNPQILTIVTPDKKRIPLTDLHYEIQEKKLSIPWMQLSENGRYQVNIHSPEYGELLMFSRKEQKEKT